MDLPLDGATSRYDRDGAAARLRPTAGAAGGGGIANPALPWVDDTQPMDREAGMARLQAQPPRLLRLDRAPGDPLLLLSGGRGTTGKGGTIHAATGTPEDAAERPGPRIGGGPEILARGD